MNRAALIIILTLLFGCSQKRVIHRVSGSDIELYEKIKLNDNTYILRNRILIYSPYTSISFYELLLNDIQNEARILCNYDFQIEIDKEDAFNGFLHALASTGPDDFLPQTLKATVTCQ